MAQETRKMIRTSQRGNKPTTEVLEMNTPKASASQTNGTVIRGTSAPSAAQRSAQSVQRVKGNNVEKKVPNQSMVGRGGWKKCLPAKICSYLRVSVTTVQQRTALFTQPSPIINEGLQIHTEKVPNIGRIERIGDEAVVVDILPKALTFSSEYLVDVPGTDDVQYRSLVYEGDLPNVRYNCEWGYEVSVLHLSRLRKSSTRGIRCVWLLRLKFGGKFGAFSASPTWHVKISQSTTCSTCTPLAYFEVAQDQKAFALELVVFKDDDEESSRARPSKETFPYITYVLGVSRGAAPSQNPGYVDRGSSSRSRRGDQATKALGDHSFNRQLPSCSCFIVATAHKTTSDKEVKIEMSSDEINFLKAMMDL
ncbi:hypothetical protein HAX54_002347 [Datura stramonium]|uniref:Uncharacterized protein n=1 Tax=Datura stramonium TaxID=4076 RepID=A0ABS8T4Z1_DATST|nr:hypothetical protein [Datura stramonium]